MQPTVTGVVLTFNGRRLLTPCLKSLDFCDQILVVDSGSTDGSRELAESLGARVIQNTWAGFGPQLLFALTRVDTDWVVCIDQDEQLSPELRASIREALPKAPADLAGFYVPRRSFYFDRFLTHSGWYPDYLLRVFRKDRLEVTMSGAHEHLRPKGPTRKLAGDIVHYPYSGFAEQMVKGSLYAQAAADEMRAKGRRGGVITAVAHAKMRFFKLYVLKLGFLDGRAGLVNALCAAYYVFQKYIRAEEKGDWGNGN